ncbi:restriction endonuclease subunit S [Vibrio sp. 10N.261.51.A3]|uniref:restriction endonuclease subunit S n=1 Tax=Vibrio sp. 10N.261.51.A3 TaxID=3229673 RepID=UPI00354F5DEE
MGSNFFSTTIGEQITLQRGFDITKKEQQEGNVPVVSSGGISSFHNVSKVEAPGVVLGRKGTLGTVFFVEKDFWPHDTSLWVKDFKGNNPQFVYYFFKGMSAELKKMDVGAANPALNRNHVHPLQVEWPRREVQDQIVSVGAALDQKITLNNQINQTLEQMAQTLFKSWFVDFDPVKAKMNDEQPEWMDAPFLSKEVASLFPEKLVESELGLIPEGWNVESIKDFGDVICGKTPSKKNADFYGGHVPFIKIPDTHGKVFITETSDTLTQAGDESQPKKRIPENSICVSCIATVGQVFVTTKPSHTNQQINSVVPNDANALYYLLFKFKGLNKHFHDLASGGSATLNMNTSTFSKVVLVRPTADVLKAFHKTVGGLMDKMLVNQLENATLSKLRDTLLPKLLSGEIDLENVQVEQAKALAE